MANILQRNREVRRGSSNLPFLSTALDSVRPYQFEVQFTFDGQLQGPNSTATDAITNLTIGAKQIQAGGLKVNEVLAHRLNDVYYYPGKPEYDTLQITFDNILLTETGQTLYKWFQICTFDPLDGTQAKAAGFTTGGRFKAPLVRVIEYNGRLDPVAYVDYRGVFPTTLSFGERNYATTTEFHTLSVTFRYDIIDTWKET